jgi:hypothetical protein
MRSVRVWVLALVACGAVGWSSLAVAQPLGIDPNRDCQVITTCRYTSGGVYRGCLSSYSCRVCRLVSSRCDIGGPTARVCQRMQCTWG